MPRSDPAGRGPTRIERIGVVLFRAALLLLPRPLRHRAGEEMLEIFRERHRRSRGAGILAAWALELGGILRTAVRARLGRAQGPPANGRRPAGSGFMETLLQDVRYALRALARRPTFTTLAVITFGLGIAGSTAMFSVVDAVLLRPLPFPEPEEIVSLYVTSSALRSDPMREAAERGAFSFPEFEEAQSASGEVLEAIAGWGRGSGMLQGDGPPEQIALGRVTPGLFSRVLRVEPLLGRTFTEEDAAMEAPVLVLSEGLWRRIGADPSIVGSTLHMGIDPYVVIGVVPDRSELADPRFDVEAWTLHDRNSNRGTHSVSVLGRLRDGVSPDEAAARLSAAREAAEAAGVPHEHAVNVFSRHDEETRDARGVLLLLMLAALLLLLVACGNVAVLVVGAALDRSRELAVREALGAGGRRILRQLVTEGLVLAALGAALGLILAVAAADALMWLAPSGIPRIGDAAVDPRALGVATGLTVLCGVVFGATPALTIRRANLRGAMATRAVTSGSRVQSAVVVGELALATLLLLGAGLLGRTVLAMGAVDPGFDANRLLGARVVLPSGYLVEGLVDDRERRPVYDAFHRRIMEEVAALPGVEAAAMTTDLPLSADPSGNQVAPEGYEGEFIMAERRFVTANYFEVTGIRIIEGRAFEPDDDRFDDGGPVPAIVSAGLATRAWPGEPAVGKAFDFFWGRDAVVVGVAADVRDESLRVATGFAFYVPLRAAGFTGGALVVRTAGDPADQVAAVRRRIWEVDGGVAIPSIQPLSIHLREQIAAEIYRARLVIVFAALATLFSLMGVYGITARSVVARTRELGIRLALGAKRTGVMRLVLRQALRLALLGALAGIAVSLVALRFIESYLFGVEATDVPTLIGTPLMIAAASVLAALAPGRRASRVDPVEALREEG